eukprot:7829396-Alexandrium_andersonii.AAC.1
MCPACRPAAAAADPLHTPQQHKLGATSSPRPAGVASEVARARAEAGQGGAAQGDRQADRLLLEELRKLPP